MKSKQVQSLHHRSVTCFACFCVDLSRGPGLVFPRLTYFAFGCRDATPFLSSDPLYTMLSFLNPWPVCVQDSDFYLSCLQCIALPIVQRLLDTQISIKTLRDVQTKVSLSILTPSRRKKTDGSLRCHCLDVCLYPGPVCLVSSTSSTGRSI